MKRFLTYIIALASCMTSCDKVGNVTDDMQETKFTLNTKAASLTAGTSTTYRIMLYKRTDNEANFQYYGDNRFGTAYGYGTGTYYLKAAGEPLTACSVDESGNYIEDNPDAGIRGTVGDVWISYISPAIQNYPDGTFNLNPENEFLCSPAKEAVVNGFGTIDLNESAGGSSEPVTLMDMRSKIEVNFFQGSDAGFTISSLNQDSKPIIYLRGIGNDGDLINFNPATGKIKTSVGATGRSCLLTPISGESAVTGLGTRLYTTTRIVPAADYGNNLIISYKMTQGAREVDLTVLLSSDLRTTRLEPMKIYTYNIVTMSGYVNVTLDIHKPNPSAGADYWYEREGFGDVGIIAKDIPIVSFRIEQDDDGNWIAKNLNNPDVGSTPAQTNN